MSGGYMNYICFQIEEEAVHLQDSEMEALARDLATVYHDAEWWHSGDIEEDSYRDTVRKFKKKWFKGNRTERLKGYIDEEFNSCKERCMKMLGEV